MKRAKEKDKELKIMQSHPVTTYRPTKIDSTNLLLIPNKLPKNHIKTVNTKLFKVYFVINPQKIKQFLL